MSDEETEHYNRLALEYARYYAGKIQIIPKVPVRGLEDFAVWYTPGVAAVSRAIARNKELAFHLTGRWNTIAILSDGSRVLGLGKIGPEGGLPVMEGKALIFKYLGGVDALPLPIRANTAEEFIAVAKALEPSLGGINLEDIESPVCFRLLETLRKELEIVVWHDDQQGTAASTLAGLINALKLTGRSLKESRYVLFGAGAANICTAELLIAAGAEPKNLILVDSKGALHADREDMDMLMLHNPWKYELALKTNKDKLSGSVERVLKGADVLISASRPGPGIIRKEWVAGMNKDSIVFALANPIPEIWPWEAEEAGAKIVATGRSDFPNQINNSLVFPAVFRGALDARAKTVTTEMALAAAEALAAYAEPKLDAKHIIPTMEEWEVYPHVAAAVAVKAVEQNVARLKRTKEEFYSEACRIISASREALQKLIANGLIKLPEVK